jgi:CheY-like chemotaxis protein/anti-sigma regulatory factor (Ser/Thr protein kinase)
MPTILVADDVVADRGFAGGILEGDTEFEIKFAVDGADALRQIESSAPDLVLTDMMMPNMDGLELVHAVRERYPHIPVILMTSQGSEKLAVDALAAGAASYVPKSELLNELLSTVHHVLALSSQERSHARLMAEMTHSRSVFQINNDSELITSLVGHLQENVSHMGICDEAERIRFGVALEEALVNAMYHGNLEVDSSLKEEGSEVYESLVQQRRREPPYGNRTIEIQAELCHTEAVVTVTDEGPGFDPASLPDPTDPENLDKVSGRGVLLMRTFMDDVEFSDSGNRVVMTKRRKSQ